MQYLSRYLGSFFWWLLTPTLVDLEGKVRGQIKKVRGPMSLQICVCNTTLLLNHNTKIRLRCNIHGDIWHFMKLWPLTYPFHLEQKVKSDIRYVIPMPTFLFTLQLSIFHIKRARTAFVWFWVQSYYSISASWRWGRAIVFRHNTKRFELQQ